MSTQAESYRATKPSIPTRREQILNLLFMNVPMSRAEIALATGMRLSSVCGRVNELIRDGKIHVAGEQWDDETQRNVETVSL